jgi:metallo-beta-lactamase class B
MRKRGARFGTAVAFSAFVAVVFAATQAAPRAQGATTVDGLIAAAKSAAGTNWAGTFLRLCIPPPPTTGRGGAANAAAGAGATAAGGARGAGAGANGAAGRGAARGGTAPARGAAAAAPAGRGAPPRETWYAEPAKVADNLYFLGTTVHNAWALVGSDGIIVLEALFDYAAPDEVIGGMKALGLDTQKVKYIVISHAHADHDGGARFLQDSLPQAHLVYGGPDWDTVDNAANHAGGKPKRDTVGADGMRLSVGDASLQIVTTPGHTPGTLSFLFEVKDHGKPMRVAYVGGTAIPFNGTAEYYDTYLASERKMAKAAADFGATALMSNHTEFDNGFYKSHTANDRKGAEPNPFDVGATAVGNYFKVVDSCVSAAKLRATGKL